MTGTGKRTGADDRIDGERRPGYLNGRYQEACSPSERHAIGRNAPELTFRDYVFVLEHHRGGLRQITLEYDSTLKCIVRANS